MPHAPAAAARADRESLWLWLAVSVWAVFAIVSCVRAFGWPWSHSVYPIYANAARQWLVGGRLYQPADGLDVYRYSPSVAVFLVPLAQLPDRLGGVLWRLINLAVYLGALAWWVRTVAPLRLSRGQRAVFFFLVFLPSIGSLNNGQSNVLVMSLLLAAVAGVRRRSWNLAAGCVTLASLFKVYPLAVGLLLVPLYPRHLAPRLALGLAAGLALPFLFQEPAYVLRQYQEWGAHLQENDRQARPREAWYRDVRLLDWAWRQPVDSMTYQAAEVAAGIAIAALCWHGRRAGWPERRLLTGLLALGCCWMTVLGPATEPCTYTLLAPALAWAVLQAWLVPQPPLLRLGFGMSYALLLTFHLSGWLPDKAAIRDLGPDALGGLLFLGCLLYEWWRTGIRRVKAGLETTAPLRPALRGG